MVYQIKLTTNGLAKKINAGQKVRNNMADIKTLIIEAAHRRDLTFAQNFNGRAYALFDADWIGYFNTLDEVLEFLDISEGKKEVKESDLSELDNEDNPCDTNPFGDSRFAG